MAKKLCQVVELEGLKVDETTLASIKCEMKHIKEDLEALKQRQFDKMI